MAEKKVLLDVDIKMTQAIKDLGELRMKNFLAFFAPDNC